MNSWQPLTDYKGYSIVVRWTEEPVAWRVEWAVGTLADEKLTMAMPATAITFSKLETGLLNCFMGVARDAKLAIDDHLQGNCPPTGNLQISK